jgi:hypothetical protein
VDEEVAGPPEGEPLEERARLQGVFEVGEREDAVADFLQVRAKVADVVGDGREAVGGSAQAHTGMMRRDVTETTNPRSFGSGSSMRPVSDSDLGGPRGTLIRRELELPTFIRRTYA